MGKRATRSSMPLNNDSKTLADLVLKMEGLQAQKASHNHEMNEEISALRERISKLAVSVRDGQTNLPNLEG